MSFINHSPTALGGLKSVHIFSPQAPSGFDIASAVVEFNLFESIRDGFISGNLAIVDEYNLLSTINIVGLETIVIRVVVKNEKAQDVFLDLNMVVTGVTDYNRRTTDDTATYKIQLSSLNMFNDLTTRISQAYEGPSSDIIENILIDHLHLNTSDYVLEPTTDNMKVVIPNMRPSIALKWITRRAVSSTLKPMFFYETLSGFKLVSYENLVKEDASFKYTKTQATSMLEFDRRWLIEHVKSDILYRGGENIRNGVYAAKVHAFNPITKQFVFYEDFNIKNSAEKHGTSILNDVSIDSGFEVGGRKIYEFNNSKHFYMISSTDTLGSHESIGDYHSNAHVKVPELNSKIHLLTNGSINIHVGGNIALTPGLKINCAFPNTQLIARDDIKEENLYDTAVSGNYLVLATRHIFTVDSFKSVVHLSKDSISLSGTGT